MLSYPAACPLAVGDEMVILFAIKSMPSHSAMREVIRGTWLNQKFWNFGPKIRIHSIFLMGVEDGHDVQAERDTYRDILQYDFLESHYNLTVKDIKLLEYIASGWGISSHMFQPMK